MEELESNVKYINLEQEVVMTKLRSKIDKIQRITSEDQDRVLQQLEVQERKRLEKSKSREECIANMKEQCKDSKIDRVCEGEKIDYIQDSNDSHQNEIEQAFEEAKLNFNYRGLQWMLVRI